jgi:AraC-like DNA-binding protein
MIQSTYSCRKVSPQGFLADYVWYFYSIRGVPDPGRNDPEPWFPTGTMDMVIDLGAAFEQGVLSGPMQLRPKAFVTGLFEEGIRIRPTGPVYQLGVVFKPGKFRYFIPGDQYELKGAVTPLRDIFGRRGDHLVESLADARNEHRAYTLLQTFLEKSLRPELDQNYFIDLCIRNILKNRGNISLQDLAGKKRTSARHFRRIFKDYVGINPKLYCTMVRLQNLIRLSAENPVNLNKLSNELGYFDPAHLSRDFRNMTGMKAIDFVRREDLIARSLVANQASAD